MPEKGDEAECVFCGRKYLCIRRTQVTCGRKECVRQLRRSYRYHRQKPQKIHNHQRTTVEGTISDDRLRQLEERARAKKPLFG